MPRSCRQAALREMGPRGALGRSDKLEQASSQDEKTGVFLYAFSAVAGLATGPLPGEQVTGGEKQQGQVAWPYG